MKLDRVYTLDAAMDWFMTHSGGSLECIDGFRELVVTSYPQAVVFYAAKSGRSNG